MGLKLGIGRGIGSAMSGEWGELEDWCSLHSSTSVRGLTSCIGDPDGNEGTDKESVEHDREGGEYGLVNLKFKDVGVTGRPLCDKREIDELSSVVENDDDDVSLSSGMLEAPSWPLTLCPEDSQVDEEGGTEVDPSVVGRLGRGRTKRLLSLDGLESKVTWSVTTVSSIFAPTSEKPAEA